MSNALTPFGGTLTSPFGSFLSDRLFDSVFDDALAYPFTNTSRHTRGIDARYAPKRSIIMFFRDIIKRKSLEDITVLILISKRLERPTG